MLGNQGLINVSMVINMRWATDKTCRFISNHNVYIVFLVNCFEEIRPSMLHKSTKRIAGKCHWIAIVRLTSLTSNMLEETRAVLTGN